MFVREIMTPRVEAVTPEMTIQQAAALMRDKNIGCLMVQQTMGDKLIGILTDRDITCRSVAAGKNPKMTLVKEAMSEEAVYCFDDQDLADVAQIMEAKKLHRLPVMDHSENVIGLISLTDIALHGSRDLSAEVLNAVSDYIH